MFHEHIQKHWSSAIESGMTHKSWEYTKNITALNPDKLLIRKREDFLFSDDIIQMIDDIKKKSTEENTLSELFDIYKNPVNETSYTCDELIRMAYLIGCMCKYDHPIVNRFDFRMIGNYLNYVAIDANITQLI
jgi:hypothetical protein